MQRANVRTIIADAAQELGLGPAVFASQQQDATGWQMGGLLNSLGDELLRVHDWQFLLKTATMVGDGVQTQFPLPADFGRQVNQTQWDNSNKRPLMGPDSPQLWGWSQYGIVSVGIYYRYRIAGDRFEIFPTPDVGQQFAFYYISRNWVEDGNNAGTYKSRITLDSDIPLYDARLMTVGLKQKFWSIKGFDTTTLTNEFNMMLGAEKAQSQGAPIINLSGGMGHWLINELNIPDGSLYGLPQ